MSLSQGVLQFLQRRRGNTQASFAGSAPYWEGRYKRAGTSGNGSYGALAAFKAEILNGLICEYKVRSIIDFGCGDGNQIGLLEVESYTGVDVSETAIARCRSQYVSDPSKRFFLATPDADYPQVDMAMSLDVIFHLIEDEVYERYMRTLFDTTRQFVTIYSSNGKPDTPKVRDWPPHVLHRTFTTWVEQNAHEWKLNKYIPNRYPYDLADDGREVGSFADFYLYERR